MVRKIKRQTLTCSAPKADEQEELSRFRDFLISRNGLLVFTLDLSFLTDDFVAEQIEKYDNVIKSDIFNRATEEKETDSIHQIMDNSQDKPYKDCGY